MSSVGHLAHLVRRFLGSLSPAGPGADAETWVEGMLLPGELELWRRMSGPDRRHAVGVARRVGSGKPRPVVAAALLHDVGKIDAGLGTFGRVAATIAGRRLVGRESRYGRYLRHDAIGAGLLRSAGSDPLTVAWAAEHHLPPSQWTVPAEVGAALKAADDD